ncbi:unnamed protein product [Periconia digitata]|uniref:Glutaredoxin domain-containing protein n=1 Tax=Periconia digitata TaxID=1303443 RepID=A0A9W4U6R7_9PLEO|nr:unnamed protein product [Periconia digitata]
MPSQRRMRVTSLVILLVIVVVLYMTTSASRTQNSAFYVKTQEALQANQQAETVKQQQDADDARTRLKVAEEAAKKSADEKHQKYLESVGGSGTENKGKSVGGGKFKVQLPDGDERKKGVPGVAAVGGRPRDKQSQETETQEDHEIETELNDILKKSPIIIFSKSYCPHSAKAKHILLDKYNIVPEPYVVELDIHPLGLKLQETLANKTGRRTVPNILVLGKSIGGGSEMQELDEADKLIDTVKSMGGSRVTEVLRKDSPTPKEIRKRRVVRLPHTVTLRVQGIPSSPRTPRTLCRYTIHDTVKKAMCTYFTLHYRCTHTRISHRCPASRAATEIPSTNEDRSPTTFRCGNEHFLEGNLDDDCISCKVSRGVVPGSQMSGFQAWAQGSRALRSSTPRVERGSNAGSGISGKEAGKRAKEEVHGLVSLDPRLLDRSGSDPDLYYHRNGGENAETGAKQGLVTQAGCNRPRASSDTQDCTSCLHPAHVDKTQSTEFQIAEGSPPTVTQENEGGSNRMREIFERLSAYSRFPSPPISRVDSPQRGVDMQGGYKADSTSYIKTLPSPNSIASKGRKRRLSNLSTSFPEISPEEVKEEGGFENPKSMGDNPLGYFTKHDLLAVKSPPMVSTRKRQRKA